LLQVCDMSICMMIKYFVVVFLEDRKMRPSFVAGL